MTQLLLPTTFQLGFLSIGDRLLNGEWIIVQTPGDDYITPQYGQLVCSQYDLCARHNSSSNLIS